jgi:hypothetical protein
MVSVRRFEKEGRFAYMMKGIKLNLHRTFRGEIRNEKVVKYEFDAWNKAEEPEDDFLDLVEERLLKLEEHSRRMHRRAGRQTKEQTIKQLTPRLNEYSHLIETLDIYLNREERNSQRWRRFRHFFIWWTYFFRRKASRKLVIREQADQGSAPESL